MGEFIYYCNGSVLIGRGGTYWIDPDVRASENAKHPFWELDYGILPGLHEFPLTIEDRFKRRWDGIIILNSDELGHDRRGDFIAGTHAVIIPASMIVCLWVSL